MVSADALPVTWQGGTGSDVTHLRALIPYEDKPSMGRGAGDLLLRGAVLPNAGQTALAAGWWASALTKLLQVLAIYTEDFPLLYESVKNAVPIVCFLFGIEPFV